MGRDLVMGTFLVVRDSYGCSGSGENIMSDKVYFQILTLICFLSFVYKRSIVLCFGIPLQKAKTSVAHYSFAHRSVWKL